MFRSSASLRRAAKSFISFITVRHPFERLLSADRDRFFAMDSSESEVNKAALYRRRSSEGTGKRQSIVVCGKCKLLNII